MRAAGKVELMSSEMISVFQNTVKLHAICICMRVHYGICQRDNECVRDNNAKKLMRI